MTPQTPLSPLSERVVPPSTVVPTHPLVAEWRPATLDDVDAVWEVRRASDAVDHPNYVATREEIEEDLGYSFVDLEQDTLLALGHDGRPLAFGMVLEPPRQETLVREFMNGYVHPAVRGQGIGRQLIRWQRARGEQRLAASAKRLPGWLMGYADRRATDRERLLVSAGFTAVRWFHTMERELSRPVPEVAPTEPVTIRTYAEAIVDDAASEAAHTARDEAFRDHWGSQPLSDEQWASLTSRTFVPELSFVAFAADGSIAGLLLTDVNEDDWAGQGFTGAYVSTVAVTRPHRGRRIAPALLAEVLRACAARGWERVVLDVDADNPTGALSLYTGMGFVPTQHETGLIIEY